MIDYKRITPEDILKVVDLDGKGDELSLVKYSYQLWDLENKIKNGGLLSLPCKIGDPIYVIHNHKVTAGIMDSYNSVKISANEISGWMYVKIGRKLYSYRLEEFGNSSFLTKQEAEKALKEKDHD